MFFNGNYTKNYIIYVAHIFNWYINSPTHIEVRLQIGTLRKYSDSLFNEKKQHVKLMIRIKDSEISLSCF